MVNNRSIYWHDYETFGSDPRKDRACQFAGIRTDEELNIIDDPLVIYCRPAQDVIPDPVACLITGITPQEASEKGLTEAEFAARIMTEFTEPQTCVAGYNNLRFDDEITRHLFYRCFIDPYEREWKQGNSRWDIIDLLRMCYALRPEGLNWPKKPDGTPSFKLEEFTRLNGIAHEGAHDALADVHATIETARLIKQKQVKLYDYYFSRRKKNAVLPMFNLDQPEPLIHISSMYPASRGCMAVVLPMLIDPGNPNGIIVFDLSQDPSIWMNDSIEEMKLRLFTAKAELPADMERPAFKTVHTNRCPALAPMNVLTDEIKNKFDIDLDLCARHQQRLLKKKDLQQKMNAVFKQEFQQENDPDLMLYSGGFFDSHDKAQFEKIRRFKPEELAVQKFAFNDHRLPEMLFRYRCRNNPEYLNKKEQQQWHEFCRENLTAEQADGTTRLDEVNRIIAEKLIDADSDQALLLGQLSQYISSLCRGLGINTQ